MDWTTQTEVVTRIIALLLGLADLADRASLASPAVRCEVLWYLRQGEMFAQVAQPASDLDAPPAIVQFTAVSTTHLASDSPDEASRLAAALRALSLAWATLLAWMLRIARHREDGLPVAPGGAAAGPARVLAAPLPHDTS